MRLLHLRLRAIFVLSCILSLRHATAEKLPTFGDVVPIPGGMTRTDQGFQDGLTLDLYSPKPRTLTVRQNLTPLPGQFVTGTTGEPFVALSNYSYVVKMNETANDLIAKIEIPYDVQMLNKLGIQEANTYVGKLAADKESWFVNDQTRNVRRLENLTRIIKMTSLDGEYMILGRKTIDTINIFVQYGQGEVHTVNISRGGGTQEAEFVDGLRLSVESQGAMRINMDILNGINPARLPSDSVSLNSFAWVVNSSAPTTSIEAELKVPFNRRMLADLNIPCSSPTKMLTVAKCALNDTRGQFQPINPRLQIVRGQNENRISVKGLTQLDGQYIILVTPGKCVPKNTTCGSSSTTRSITTVGSLTTTKPITTIGPSTTTKSITASGASTTTNPVTISGFTNSTKSSTTSGSSTTATSITTSGFTNVTKPRTSGSSSMTTSIITSGSSNATKPSATSGSSTTAKSISTSGFSTTTNSSSTSGSSTTLNSSTASSFSTTTTSSSSSIGPSTTLNSSTASGLSTTTNSTSISGFSSTTQSSTSSASSTTLAPPEPED